jgi:hypothetical protein
MIRRELLVAAAMAVAAVSPVGAASVGGIGPAVRALHYGGTMDSHGLAIAGNPRP